MLVLNNLTGFGAMGGAGDPFVGNVSLLLHCDGANGSTSFPDAVGLNTMSVAGSASVSTSQSKFGGASLSTNGGAGYIFAPGANASFVFGSGDFTIECWIYPSALGLVGIMGVAGSSAANVPFDLFMNGSSLNGRVSDGAAFSSVGGGTIVTAAWQHVAMSKQATTLRLFLNGSLVNTNNSAPATIANNAGSNQFRVGGIVAGNLNGFIDEVRITKGIARYTASFTPPDAPFLPQ